MSSALEIKSRIHQAIGDYDSTLVAIKAAIHLVEQIDSSHEKQAYLLLQKGIAHWRLNRIDTALVDIERSMSILAELVPSPTVKTLLSQDHVMLGLLHWRQNNYERALDYYQSAVLFYKQDEESHLRDLFITYLNIAALYSDQLQYDSTIAYQTLGQEYLSRLPKTSPYYPYIDYYKYQSYSNIAYAHRWSGDLKQAESYLNRAIKLCIDFRGPDHPDLLYLLNVQTNLSIDQNQPNEALKASQKAFDIAIKTFDKTNPQISQQYNMLAEVNHILKKYDDAHALVDSALAANLTFSHGKDIVHSGTDEFYRSIELKLIFNSEKNNLTSQDIDDLYALFKSNYAHILFEQDNDYIKNQIESIIYFFFDFYFGQYKSIGSTADIERLIELSEIKKSRSLLRIMALNDGLLKNIDPTISSYEKTLRDSISLFLYGTKKTAKSDSTLYNLKIRHSALMDKIEKNTTTTSSMFLDAIDFDLKECISSIRANEALVFFFQSHDALYSIPVTAEGADVNRIELDSTPSNNNSLSTEEKDTIVNNIWNAISLPDQYEFIEIIPDGIVWELNFESAIIHAKNKPEYLGIAKNILYQYSYNFKKVNMDKKEVPSPSFLVLSYSDLEQDINPLPGGQKETEILKNIWNHIYVQQHYSSSEFKSNAGRHSIIHITLHSLVDTTDSDKSRIIFSSNDTAHIDQLHSYDIANLNINAELVSLSSCRTGSGYYDHIEGIVGLGRSFVIAGAKGVLASRTDVIDSKTPILMKLFYENLQKGYRKSKALRLARLEYVSDFSDNITGHPRFWSNFYLIGSDDPLEYRSSSKTIWWLPPIIMVVVFILGGIARRKRNI